MVASVQLFNQINARKIHDEMNVFSGIIHSHLFIYIWIAEAGLQVHGLSPRVSPSLLVAQCHQVPRCCCKVLERLPELKQCGAPR